VGSVTKTFTATVVLRLAEEGRVELDDPLGRYLPGIVPRGNRITVRQLLNHTSGLANYTDYTSWLAQAEHSTSTHPLDVLRFAASRRPVFTRPGSRWSYSNTNYIALGLIIENVTGSSFRNALERYVIRPLDLRHTELARRRLLPGLLDSGANPNLPSAAGGLVSNAHDLARFYSALLTGDLLSVASLTEMRRTVRTTGPDPYGLRLRSIRHSCGSAWGHGGTILDYGTVVEATSDGRRVAVVVTRGKSDRNPDMGALLCS